MSKSRFEEVYPTLGPLSKKTGRGALRVLSGVGRGVRWLTRRTWKQVFAVVLLVLIADGVATVITGRMVDAEIDKIRARGEYLSYKDLIGQPVPDSENGALIYEQAFKLVPEPSQQDMACELLLDPEKRAKDPGLWQKAQTELSKYGGALVLIDQAQRMPACRFKANWEDGPAALFHYLSRLRQVSRILCAQALIKAYNGDMAGGLACLKRVVAVQETIKNDPTIIHSLVRDAILNQAAGTLRQMAEMGKMPADGVRELADDLGRIDLVPGFMNGLRGERVTTIWAFDLARTKGAGVLWNMAGGEGSPSPWLWLYCSRLGRPWLYNDEARALRYWSHMLEVSKREYRTVTKVETELLESETDKCGPIGSILLPVFSRARAAADRSQAQVNGSRVLLALPVYKERFGSYPETLDKLESSLGWGLKLIDPLGGKEFVYRRVGNGFVFYSVGENMKDEGGWDDYTPAQRATYPHPDKPDDIVWKMDH